MYAVEKIVTSRLNSAGKKQYLVKWIGYDSSQNTWQPQKNLSTVKPLLRKFNNQNLKKDDTKETSKKRSSQETSSHFEEDSKFCENELSLISSQEQESRVRQESKQGKVLRDQQLNVSKGKKIKKKVEKPKNGFENSKPHLPNLRVTGIATDDNGKYVYRVLINEKIKWVKRTFFVPHFLNELCEYYEESITLKS